MPLHARRTSWMPAERPINTGSVHYGGAEGLLVSLKLVAVGGVASSSPTYQLHVHCITLPVDSVTVIYFDSAGPLLNITSVIYQVLCVYRTTE